MVPVAMILFYMASAINILSYIYLIYNIWKTKSCAGLSGKTHILYAVANIGRFTDFFSSPFNLYLEFKITDAVRLVLICIIVLSLYVSYKETREPQYDTFSVKLPVICCFAVATIVNPRNRFDLIYILWAFSIYLEAIAMLPQFRVFSEAGHLNTHVLKYLIAIAVGQFLYLLSMHFKMYNLPWIYDKNLIMASYAVQVILFIDFFLRFSPIKLQIVKASNEISIPGDQEQGNGGIKNDSLKDNALSSIVLTPASLLNASANDKANLLKDEEAK